MLVLTRKVDEAIRIGEGLDAIEVTVVRIDGNKVRLGISAPGTLRISRFQQGESRERTSDEQPGDQL
jgi:carbon storage regulator CsrA